VPVIDTETMEHIVSISTARERFNMLLMTLFGCAALVLAALGLGTVALVARRAGGVDPLEALRYD
jgi:hypothetical protein